MIFDGEDLAWFGVPCVARRGGLSSGRHEEAPVTWFSIRKARARRWGL